MAPFQSTPNEVLLEICHWMDARSDLRALSLVNKQWHAVADPVLWRREASLDRPGPLHWAIDCGSTSLVRKALYHGADPNQPAYVRRPRPGTNTFRWWDYAPTPRRSTAGRPGSPTRFRRHQTTAGVWAEFGRPFWRPIHLAVTKGRVDLVELLLDHGASINELSWRLCDCLPHPSIEMFPSITHEDDGVGLGFMDIRDGGWTPLHVAICHRDVEMAKMLLRRGASVDTHRDTRWYRRDAGVENSSSNITAMHDAALHGLLELMVFLVDEGYQSVNTYANLVGKPIHVAIWNKHLDTVVPWLQEKGASVDEPYPEDGAAPLLTLCIKQQFDSAVRLIELGANVSPSTSGALFTALHLLAHPPPDNQRGLGRNQTATKSELARLLISKGLSVDAADGDIGSSPLIVASSFCDLDMMRTLLECGADPNYRDQAGATAFNKVAVLTESYKPPIYGAGQMLIDAGLDIRGPFAENQTTPLNSVCLARTRPRNSLFRESEFQKLAELLLARGADPNEQGRFSSGPFTQAVFSGSFAMANLLLENGSRAEPADLEMLLRPMTMKPSYQPGLVKYVLDLDHQAYGLQRPSDEFLDDMVKTAFIQGAWQGTADFILSHRGTALPRNALQRALDRATQELHTTSQLPHALIRVLLLTGADPNVTWKSEPALYYAGRTAAFTSCIKYLLYTGADVHMKSPNMPEGALLFFFQNGHHEALEQVLEYDGKIIQNSPEEFHSKCWEYLLAPRNHEEPIGGGLQMSPEQLAEGLATGYIAHDGGPNGTYGDLAPLAWERISVYVKHGLRMDVDVGHGTTVKDAMRRVVPRERCSGSQCKTRLQAIQSLGLTPRELGVPDEVDEGFLQRVLPFTRRLQIYNDGVRI